MNHFNINQTGKINVGCIKIASPFLPTNRIAQNNNKSIKNMISFIQRQCGLCIVQCYIKVSSVVKWVVQNHLSM